MKKLLAIVTGLVLAGMGSAMAADGELIEGVFDRSVIYPGTERDYKVYVPAQYDGKTPACLYFGLDGILYNAVEVMDSLMATGDMPVTIGVFIQPGVIKDSDGNVIRYNRSNEFDRTDGRFASFIETEILPMVESLKTSDGRQVLISHDANDRAISGASSSGIASFNVAWQRPDLFSRVYTTCGTFVAMRGGNELPALVRKSEPKPIRVYIHDGSNDAWNPLFGHWYEYNRLMASALEFAGYEHHAKWDDGNHSIRNGSRLFPEAMRYLWKDYPKRVDAGTSQNNMLTGLLIPGEQWRECDGVMPEPAPNVAVYPDGKHVTETEPGSDWLVNHVMDRDGNRVHGQQFYWIHNPLHRNQRISGMVYDTGGNLYVATEIGIQVCDQNGRVRAILPYPEAACADAFSFAGDTLYVVCGGRLYCRKVNATAHRNGDAPVAPASQGQG